MMGLRVMTPRRRLRRSVFVLPEVVQDATERSWFKVSRFCYMLMRYSCDRRRSCCRLNSSFTQDNVTKKTRSQNDGERPRDARAAGQRRTVAAPRRTTISRGSFFFFASSPSGFILHSSSSFATAHLPLDDPEAVNAQHLLLLDRFIDP